MPSLSYPNTGPGRKRQGGTTICRRPGRLGGLMVRDHSRRVDRGAFPRRSGTGDEPLPHLDGTRALRVRVRFDIDPAFVSSGCFSFLARSCRYASAPDTYRPEHARGAGLHRAPPLATADGFGYFVSLLMVFLALAAPEPPPVPLPFLPEDLLLAAFFAAPSTFLPIPAMPHYLSLAVLILVFLPTSPDAKHVCPGRTFSTAWRRALRRSCRAPAGNIAAPSLV